MVFIFVLAAVPEASDSEDDLMVNWDEQEADQNILSVAYKHSQDTVKARYLYRVNFWLRNFKILFLGVSFLAKIRL